MASGLSPESVEINLTPAANRPREGPTAQGDEEAVAAVVLGA
jgi:hypothetical protein